MVRKEGGSGKKKSEKKTKKESSGIELGNKKYFAGALIVILGLLFLLAYLQSPTYTGVQVPENLKKMCRQLDANKPFWAIDCNDALERAYSILNEKPNRVIPTLYVSPKEGKYIFRFGIPGEKNYNVVEVNALTGELGPMYEWEKNRPLIDINNITNRISNGR